MITQLEPVLGLQSLRKNRKALSQTIEISRVREFPYASLDVTREQVLCGDKLGGLSSWIILERIERLKPSKVFDLCQKNGRKTYGRSTSVVRRFLSGLALR